jgi:hypothetical protein
VSDSIKINKNNENPSINQNGNTSIKQSANVFDLGSLQEYLKGRSLSERNAIFKDAGKSAVISICSIIAIIAIVPTIGMSSMIVIFLIACLISMFILGTAYFFSFLEEGLKFSLVNCKECLCLNYLYARFKCEKIMEMEAISLLEKMIDCDKNTVEYRAVIIFLGSFWNKDNIILRCIDKGNIDLSTNAIGLLTKMFKRDDTRDIAKRIIQNYYSSFKDDDENLKEFVSRIEKPLGSGNDSLKKCINNLLNKVYAEESTGSYVKNTIREYYFSSDNNDETFGEFTSKIKGCLKLNDLKLNESITELLSVMSKSEDKDIKYIAEKIKKYFPEKIKV